MGDIFIVGPARSGTSWLQTMLAEHPDIGSPPETGLFVEFLAPMQRGVDQHRLQLRSASSDAERMNVQGLATVLTDADVLAWFRSLYTKVRERVLAEKPGATRLLEKTPDHAMRLDVIRRVVPDADVLFLVRDPREAVRSMLQASDEPWGHWASTTVEGATGRWLRNVRPPLGRADDEKLLTIRYEDLRADEAELRRVCEFVGLGDPAEWAKTPPRRRRASAGRRSSRVRRRPRAWPHTTSRASRSTIARTSGSSRATSCPTWNRAAARRWKRSDTTSTPGRRLSDFAAKRSARRGMLRARHYWSRYAASRRRPG